MEAAMTIHNASREAACTVPATLVQQLIDLVQRWDIPAKELLADSGLGAARLDLSERIPLSVMCGLLSRARLLTNEPGLGYCLGLQQRASTYGYVGLAASNASTVREAIEFALKFAPVFSTALSLEFRVEGDYALLQLDESVDLGSVRDVVLIHKMLGLETLAHTLTGRQEHAHAEMAMAEPPYNARFAHLVPRWSFGHAANRLVLSASVLDWPILNADPVSHQLLRELCERELSQLGLDRGLVASVRRSLVQDSGRFRSLQEVAEDLGVPRRTLTRRLVAQGASFSALLEQERRERALVLLRASDLPIESVAAKLGYASASIFVRAFRLWTGKTPAAYRREAKLAPPLTQA
jgi:AraC-like DNA-binding protein